MGMSFMKTLDEIGPRTDPCSTFIEISLKLLYELFILTLCFLLDGWGYFSTETISSKFFFQKLLLHTTKLLRRCNGITSASSLFKRFALDAFKRIQQNMMRAEVHLKICKLNQKADCKYALIFEWPKNGLSVNNVVLACYHSSFKT